MKTKIFNCSNIKNTLKVEISWKAKDKMLMKLLEHIVYYRRGESSDSELIDDFSKNIGDMSFYTRKEIIVPNGYISDGGSIPKIFWWILSPFENYAKNCILHDYLCDLFHLGFISRKQADKIFLESMEELKIKKSTRVTLYCFVRLYGLIRYNPLSLKIWGKNEVEPYNKEFFLKEHLKDIQRSLICKT